MDKFAHKEMDKFIHRENVALYKRQLALTNDDRTRQTLLTLLAEEETKLASTPPKS